MDNVLVDMVQRLRAIELLLRTQNQLLTKVVAELAHIRRRREDSDEKSLHAVAEELKKHA
jgi:hypothetical protein